ncbi:RNA polymerase II holoenzyme cyclin-like subunit [Pyronema domesticum]|uniref:RNA polymerase II holoenzyme cyclin-like subunit n=1 Tax=Pyronema omphalodes (strain CBS 100304) TaxID=1076935 RepID=U4KZ28_PYROM|nr:RNA polymerase II holoenzyme cyclin-like subunit [Pyronema domesticum]CCX06950.1 Similar to RNA polymerase II holoenzyme cyclin-like subunit; acc. no. Q0CV29 [Pyronema omphalodes CBS 100304]
MAANYWTSSQRKHWTMTREKLAETRQNLDMADEKALATFPLPSYRHLSIFFHLQLVRLGRRMTARQQALATAQMYVRRFYTKVPIRDTNPFLVMATCLYLALKMEECPQHIRIVVSEARTCWPEAMPSFTEKLAECEFWVISELNSYLIVHHPYRTLQELSTPLALTTEENNTSWQIINDSCITDLPLIYPPHVISLTAIFLAVFMKPSPSGNNSNNHGAHGANMGNHSSHNSHNGHSSGHSSMASHNTLGGSSHGAGAALSSYAAGSGSQTSRMAKLIEWYAESKVDMEAIIDCVQEIMALYEVWEGFGMQQEKALKDIFVKMVKNPQPSQPQQQLLQRSG